MNRLGTERGSKDRYSGSSGSLRISSWCQRGLLDVSETHHSHYVLPHDTSLVDSFIPGLPEVVSPYIMTISLVGAVIGNGIIALPSAFKLTDVYWGFGITVVSGILAWISALPLINCTQQLKVATLDELGDVIPNPWVRIALTSGALVLDLALAGAGYIVIITQAAVKLLVYLGFAPCPQLVSITLALVMACLALNRTYKNLTYANTFAFGTFMFVIGAIIYKAFTIRLPDEIIISAQRPTVTYSSLIVAFAQISTAFVCQYNIPGLYGELRASRKPFAKWYTLGGFGICTLFYILAGALPFTLFLDQTKDNSLLQMQEAAGGDSLLFATQMVLAVAILVTSPLVIYPLKVFLLGLMDKRVTECSDLQNVVSTFSIVGLLCSVALVLPRLDLIMQLAGATGGNILASITPGVISLYVEKGFLARSRAVFLIVLGVCVFVLCLWCIAVKELGG
eukprot:GHVN01083257.1.p1 GENE.GHVN01083257.1~~GHVN01083257.1.p1  ORF type:complete len:452 (+),score=8.04 GHVN01083257.1:1402-2757(+)